MKTIVCLVLSEESSGELTIAYEFIKHLQGAYHIYFLISHRFEGFLDTRKVVYQSLDSDDSREVNQAIATSFFEKVNGDFLIVSDMFTMEYASAWSGIDYNYIRCLDIPIIGIDEYEYLYSDYRVDYYGNITKKLPPLIHRCDYVLKNCPISVSRLTDKEHVMSFKLCEAQLRCEDEVRELKVKLGISLHKPMIFLTVSRWEMQDMHRLKALRQFIMWREKILYHYLKELDREVVLVHVGDGKICEEHSSKIEYHHFSGLEPELFEAILRSSDLYLTYNRVSVTLTKAIYSQVPSIVLNNPKRIVFSKYEDKLKTYPMWYRKMAEEVKVVYPFKASVFGWEHFLEGVFEQNPYMDTFYVAPFMNMKKTISMMDTLLYDSTAIAQLRNKQAAFIKELDTYKSSDEIMDKLSSKLDTRKDREDRKEGGGVKIAGIKA